MELKRKLHASACLPPGNEPPSTAFTWGWMCPEGNVSVKNWKVFPLPENWSPFLNCSIRRLVTIWTELFKLLWNLLILITEFQLHGNTPLMHRKTIWIMLFMGAVAVSCQCYDARCLDNISNLYAFKLYQSAHSWRLFINRQCCDRHSAAIVVWWFTDSKR